MIERGILICEWIKIQVGLHYCKFCIEALVFPSKNLDVALYTILLAMVLVLYAVLYMVLAAEL